ncbi:hypothetical protein [Rhizobium sp. 18065]|uniref:hypothetical protein n=1 Tax=Rhizobium sp. 18065 TaxID=2681411 RepID=UPI00135B9415|nr:hypothetical protein [Rhizobium sp. 18065]
MPCIEISDEPAPRETEKTGFRDVSDFDRWADGAIESFDAEMDAAAGQPGDVIRFWQRGGKLSAHQQLVLDQALAANRVDQMQHVFRQAAA